MNTLGRKEPLKLISVDDIKDHSIQDVILTKKANELFEKLRKVIEKKKERKR